jgi:hypothetical protein
LAQQENHSANTELNSLTDSSQANDTHGKVMSCKISVCNSMFGHRNFRGHRQVFSKAKSIGRWRDYPAKDVDQVVSIGQAHLREFGYLA